MTPKGLMTLGSVVYICAAIGAALGAMYIVLGLVLFGGLLFGKGYGIWEERSRKPKTQGPPDAWFYYKEDGE